jgi:hypothetical protein
MSDDLHSVNTTVDEGLAFIQRHPDLNDTQKATGGLMWGLLRAVMECPNCPGEFRVPLDIEWDRPGGRIACPRCQGVWTRIADEAPKQREKKRGKRARNV